MVDRAAVQPPPTVKYALTRLNLAEERGWERYSQHQLQLGDAQQAL